MRRTYYVYLLSNLGHSVFYVGITNDLLRRVWEHREKQIEGFTKRYNICKLLYFEETDDINSAIEREKQLKDYRREKKFALIDSINPKWEDLFESIRN